LIFEENVPKASPSPPIPKSWSVDPLAVKSSRGKVIANPPMVSKRGYELSKRSIPAATPWSTSSGREKPLTWRGLDVGSFSYNRGFPRFANFAGLFSKVCRFCGTRVYGA
jgi:hypothetical protein